MAFVAIIRNRYFPQLLAAFVGKYLLKKGRKNLQHHYCRVDYLPFRWNGLCMDFTYDTKAKILGYTHRH